jgi:hypothetical protein
LADELNCTVHASYLERKCRIVVEHHLNVCDASPKRNDQGLTLRTLIESFPDNLHIKTFAAHCCSTYQLTNLMRRPTPRVHQAA